MIIAWGQNAGILRFDKYDRNEHLMSRVDFAYPQTGSKNSLQL
jgi:hypothetical protein